MFITSIETQHLLECQSVSFYMYLIEHCVRMIDGYIETVRVVGLRAYSTLQEYFDIHHGTKLTILSHGDHREYDGQQSN